ncbi:MAG: tRNA uridine-5-carboxymethylaminomethyl(34) synthesis GTPase MnmE [Spirochaetales bacterium]|jgi:tRNA modification GTPase|nr:tRNA uridine-5-carboxymethylaminomethyl(34) synthesis GTPase MnmE [Spirochaetales bacterium]
MSQSNYNTEDTIAALATPWSTSALAIIRGSGNGCIRKLSSMFRPKIALLDAPGNTVVHGTLFESGNGSPLDEVLVMIYRSPRSYTGEDSFDITCHGSLPGIVSILEAMRHAGFRDAEPGEFTLRSFLSGKMDLTQAEAVREIVDSKSTRAHSMALHRLSGSIENKISDIRQKLLTLYASVELYLDYPDDELDETSAPDGRPVRDAAESIRELLQTYRTGKLYQDGVRIAISGRTNAGKSSLFNLFLREDRSIVSEIHGTTRDYIESWISLDGIPISLFDTAGLRAGADPIEVEGIRRTGEVVDSADLILYLVDANTGVVDEDRSFIQLEEHVSKCIPIWNKIDTASIPAPAGFLPLSAATSEGFASLENSIVEKIGAPGLGAPGIGAPGIGAPATAVIDSLRQKQCLERSVEALEHVETGMADGVPLDAVATDLKDALDALGELTGEITTADILDTMFSQFCVGK